MTNLDLLNNVLSQASATQSEETPQETFDQIVAFIEQDNVDEASALIKKILAKGIPDVRLILFYYYAHFINCGIKAFLDIFPGIISIVDVQWEIIKPSDRKDKHVQNSLNWFFSQVLSKLKYAEKLHAEGKESPLWERSVEEISADQLEQVISSTKTFQDFFSQKWPKSPTKDRIMHLVKKLEDLKSFIVKEEVIEVVEEVVEQAPEPQVIKVEEKIEEVIQPIEQRVIEAPKEFEEVVFEESIEEEKIEQNSVVEHPIQLTNTADSDEKMLFLKEMDAFAQKLQLFESFIAQNNYLKAGIIARDIEQFLKTFDPLQYFPKLFGKYFSLVARHALVLSDQYDKKESLQVKSLEKLYNTNPDMFIEW